MNFPFFYRLICSISLSHPLPLPLSIWSYKMKCYCLPIFSASEATNKLLQIGAFLCDIQVFPLYLRTRFFNGPSRYVANC